MSKSNLSKKFALLIIMLSNGVRAINTHHTFGNGCGTPENYFIFNLT